MALPVFGNLGLRLSSGPKALRASPVTVTWMDVTPTSRSIVVGTSRSTVTETRSEEALTVVVLAAPLRAR